MTMKYLKTTLVLLILFVPFIANAQLSVSLQVDATPNPRISDWVNRTEIAMLTVTNLSPSMVGKSYKIVTKLLYNGQVVIQTKPAQMPLLTFGLGAQVYLIGDLINYDALEFFDDFESRLQSTGLLPSGSYVFCNELVDTNGVLLAQTRGTCRNMRVTSYQTPRAIYPTSSSVISKHAIRGLLFTWSPVTPLPPAEEGVKYTIVITEVLRGQTPSTAFFSNYPLVEEEVIGSTQFLWPPQLDPPSESKSYVWAVKATSLSGQPYIFENFGFSQPQLFPVMDPDLPESVVSEDDDDAVSNTNTSYRRENVYTSIKIPPATSNTHTRFSPTSGNAFSYEFKRAETKAQLTGGLGLYYDGYRYEATNNPTFRPTQPENLSRVNADAVLTAGQYFRMPFSIQLSKGQTNYHLPSLPEGRLIDYIQNPRNNISFNPSYKSFKSFLGTQTPNYSALSTGDIALFGVGMEVNPGLFLFGLNYGKSQAGVSYDPLNEIAGAYEQHIFATRIGVGKRDGTRFILNMVKATDDELSVAVKPPDKRAAETFTVSPQLQVRVSPQITLRTEAAASVNTFDVSGPELDNTSLESSFKPIMKINATSYTDWSNVSSIEWKKSGLGIGAEFRYVGPGFQPAGYRTFERDLMDFSLKTDINAKDNKIIVNGSIGLRRNNLENTSLDKTNRTITNLNVLGQVSENVSLNVNYSNFGFRNNTNLDTLRVEIINNTFAVNPTFQFRSDKSTQVLSISGSYNVYDDFNVATGDMQKTNSLNFNTNYQISFVAKPLTLGVNALYLINETPFTDISILNSGVNLRYRMFDRKFTPSLSYTFSSILRDDYTADQKSLLTLKTDWKITKQVSMNAGYSWSNYAYGSSRPDAVNMENRFQVALVSRF
jgi:hypothetical protein